MTGAIVQARMNSHRLPGKVMMEAAGRPMLGHLLARLKTCETLDGIVVATSTNPKDDAIAEFCQLRAIAVFRGSEDDVLDRYYQAARISGFDVIVRITADCPLIDPLLVDEMTRFFLAHAEQWDLVTNRHPLTFPDGLDLDVMPIEALGHVWRNATAVHQREHTIPFFWESGMRVYNHEDPRKLFWSQRWTLDYAEDYEVIRGIIEGLDCNGQLFTTDQILRFLEFHPEIIRLNAKHIPSRGDSD